jgi:hypothetical protein
VKTLELTGNFEKDYTEGCRIQSLAPFPLARVGHTAQSAPIPKNFNGLSGSDKSGSYSTLNKAKKASMSDLTKGRHRNYLIAKRGGGSGRCEVTPLWTVQIPGGGRGGV